MSGRRLLDAARIYGALRTVTKAHFAIRSQQLDTFSKTSTLAKAVKDQTDRVTVTAGAAFALAKKLSQDGPLYSSESGAYASAGSTSHGSKADQTVPTAQEESGRQIQQDGSTLRNSNANPEIVSLGQDTLNHRGEERAQDPLSHDSEMNIKQKDATRAALSDGSIPPRHALVGEGADVGGQDTYSERPHPEPAKRALAQQHGGQNDFKPVESGRSTIPEPSSAARKAQQLPETQIPSESAVEELGRTSPDTFTERAKSTTTTSSSLPRTKIPKRVESSEGSKRLNDQDINQDVYYSPSPGTKRDLILDEEVPEGVDLNLFHSPQVASLMHSGGREDRRKAYQARMDAAKRGSQSAKTVENESAKEPLWGEGDVVRDESDRVFRPDQPEHMVGDDYATDTKDLAASLAAEVKQQESTETASGEQSRPAHHLHESSVPSSRIGRIWQFSGLATSMAIGAVGETIRRVTGSGTDGSIMLSEANMERLVSKLSRMRGSALKLGQMMSFQDSKLLPPAINAVLQRVQDSADYMPPSQRDRVLSTNLGPNWKDMFSSFDDIPIAAASIGQVHKARLASNGQALAVKVQYPGVRDSITSDLNNLSLLLTASRLLPKGLYLDKTIANAKTELAWECDYDREASCGQRFRELVQDETDTFTVPKVFLEASGSQVLTAEYMSGKAVTKMGDLTQQERDWIGSNILRLCLRELMEWRFMQTDPNWTNFLYNRQTRKLELLDFGASREYPEEFVRPYVELLIAASRKDRETCREKSIELGYLTGQESKAMLDAHIESILTLAEPFMEDADLVDGQYDFRDQTITDRVRSKIGLMVRERLAPPPEETYSLHRKLSGAFLLCARLGSRVGTRAMFEEAVAKWRG